MSIGLLFECDDAVANWQANLVGGLPCKYNKVVGLIDSSGALVGAVSFYNWNGANIELGYHGENTLRPGIVRCLARYAIATFDPARATVVTSKRNRRLIRSLQKIGWRLEGVSRCYYGKRDCNKNAGVRLVLFRDALDKLAGIQNAYDTAAR